MVRIGVGGPHKLRAVVGPTTAVRSAGTAVRGTDAVDRSESPALLRAAFATDSPLFVSMARARPGDWLAVHTEKGQSFEVFCKNPHHAPHHTYRDLRIVPVGPPLSPHTRALLAPLCAFMDVFFPGMRTVVDPRGAPMPSSTECGARRGYEGAVQVSATALQLLAQRHSVSHSRSTFATMALCETDIYPPSDAWVFGLASMMDGAAAVSVARLYDSFPAPPAAPADAVLLLRRLCKVHMYGLKHCAQFTCLMNGSNSLPEFDGKPLYLCPVCLRKLHAGLSFDPLQREQALLEQYAALGFADDAAWSRARVAELQAAAGGTTLAAATADGAAAAAAAAAAATAS